MKEVKNPKKSLLYYWMIVLLITIVLNATLFPWLLEKSVKEVDYSTFLKYLENGEIQAVNYSDDQITFSVKQEDESVSVYKTGAFESDSTIIDKMYEAGVHFSKEIPTQ